MNRAHLQDLRELGPHALARDLSQEERRGLERERELCVGGALSQLPVYEPELGFGFRVQTEPGSISGDAYYKASICIVIIYSNARLYT